MMPTITITLRITDAATLTLINLFLYWPAGVGVVTGGAGVAMCTAVTLKGRSLILVATANTASRL